MQSGNIPNKRGIIDSSPGPEGARPLSAQEGPCFSPGFLPPGAKGQMVPLCRRLSHSLPLSSSQWIEPSCRRPRSPLCFGSSPGFQNPPHSPSPHSSEWLFPFSLSKSPASVCSMKGCGSPVIMSRVQDGLPKTPTSRSAANWLSCQFPHPADVTRRGAGGQLGLPKSWLPSPSPSRALTLTTPISRLTLMTKSMAMSRKLETKSAERQENVMRDQRCPREPRRAPRTTLWEPLVWGPCQ